MKTIPSALLTHFGLDVTTVAAALRVERTDGEVYAFTSHDEPATIDGDDYDPEQGLSVSSVVVSSGAAVGNLELTTLHDGTVFTTIDLLGGVWRNAEFYIFRYNYNSISDGVEAILAGTFGEIELKKNQVVIELRDLRQYLQQEVGSRTSKTCRYRLGLNSGLSHCPVRLDPPAWVATHAYTVRQPGDAGTGSVVKHASVPNRHFKCTTAGTSGGSAPAWNTTIGGTTSDGSVTWTTIQALTVTGTITSLTDNQVFRDSARTESADYFGNGDFEFTSGPNAGLSRRIKDYDNNGTFHLSMPFLNAVAIGHAYRATAGCRKRRDEDCIPKFDAVLDFGAEPDAPGIDTLSKPPKANV